MLVHTTTDHALMVWPKSLEIQLANGHAGDFWVIGTTISVANPAERTTDRRTVNFTDDSENPISEWNKLVVICSGNTVTCIVNGDVVNCGWNASQSKGAICLQSEGKEIHYRNVLLHRLSEHE